uniref:Uncharacterized protein n=1 Tax=Eutreptiella gymnastica TaxID=73025 RepID=A0A7S4FS79_9EUGL
MVWGQFVDKVRVIHSNTLVIMFKLAPVFEGSTPFCGISDAASKTATVHHSPLPCGSAIDPAASAAWRRYAGEVCRRSLWNWFTQRQMWHTVFGVEKGGCLGERTSEA